MNQPQFITIADKTYNVADLSEKAINLANQATTVQNLITHAQATLQSHQFTVDTLIAQLVEETKSLTPVTPEEQPKS